MSDKEEIKRQIAALQAKLAAAPETPPTKRRRMNNTTVLAPSTPSPKKKVQARDQNPLKCANSAQCARVNSATQSGVASHNKPPKNTMSLTTSTRPSAFIEKLKLLNAHDDNGLEPVTRSDGFEEKPANCTRRDERLAIIEDLVPGAEHKPIPDDPNFERTEPNSGIKLRERVLPHSSLQDHLSGRYYVSPSQLYSIVRLQANKQAYEVPVEGDWITIAVVAERGDVKFTSGPGNSAHGKRRSDEADDVFGKPEGKEANKKRKKEDEEDEDTGCKGGKKFVHLKLVDLGHRSRSSSSSSDRPRGYLRGDAQLSLLLFESDYYDKLIEKDGKKQKVRKLWRGGSGGAFEECFPGLREGTVIALLNPKVLKPFTNTKNPSASSSILALTPPSASAIAVIGTAAELGRCTVLKRDGKPCGSWVDLRISGTASGSQKSEIVCEYHVQTAVQRTRARRPEFSIGTSGMTTTAQKRKPAYDPVRQWGLKPEIGTRGPDGEATYVVNGLVASSGHVPALGNVSNTMGREEQARARRKAGANDDKALAELLEKSSSGSIASATSREALMVVQKARKALTEAKEQNAADSKARPQGKPAAPSPNTDMDDESQSRKKAFSAEMIKRLGFDPTVKTYSVNTPNPKTTGKLANLSQKNREIQLGPPPGPKVRSGVTVAHLSTSVDTSPAGTQHNRRTDSLNEDTAERAATGHPIKFNDEVGSDSDSDLEIEPPLSKDQEEMTLEDDL